MSNSATNTLDELYCKAEEWTDADSSILLVGFLHTLSGGAAQQEVVWAIIDILEARELDTEFQRYVEKGKWRDDKGKPKGRLTGATVV